MDNLKPPSKREEIIDWQPFYNLMMINEYKEFGEKALAKRFMGAANKWARDKNFKFVIRSVKGSIRVYKVESNLEEKKKANDRIKFLLGMQERRESFA